VSPTEALNHTRSASTRETATRRRRQPPAPPAGRRPGRGGIDRLVRGWDRRGLRSGLIGGDVVHGPFPLEDSPGTGPRATVRRQRGRLSQIFCRRFTDTGMAS
jgi:hypothetical protein